MSFSNEVKNELARIEGQKSCCDKGELYGLLKMSGAIVLSGRNIGIHFSTENAALARRMLQLLKTNFKLQTEVVITRSRRLKKITAIRLGFCHRQRSVWLLRHFNF